MPELKKITLLPELVDTPAIGDLAVIVDISEPFDINKTKKITFANLVNLAAQAAVQKIVNAQAAGDLFYADGATSLARLAKGTAGQFLKQGVSIPEWSAGGMTLIEEKLLSAPAASFDFTAIPATYKHLKILLNARGTQNAATSSLKLIINNDTGANYDYRNIATASGAGGVASIGVIGATSIITDIIPCATATAGEAGSQEIILFNYAKTTFRKSILAHAFAKYAEGALADSISLKTISGIWRDTSAINRITLLPAAGNILTGSIASLYGIA